MALLETASLTKQFGKFTAVDDVDYELGDSEVASIIGPNGAGKTTFFNLVSGEFPPTEGSVRFRDEDITDLTPSERVRAGMARVFQISNLFPSLSTFEHVRLAVQAQRIEGTRDWLADAHSDDEVVAETRRILEDIGIAHQSSKEASALPHGDKRKLEIGIAIATDPDLILLDEPTGGLPDEEVLEIVEFLKTIAEDRSLLIVEHKIDVVMELSDHISVLHNGEVIARGTPAEIQENDRVQRVYLGDE